MGKRFWIGFVAVVLFWSSGLSPIYGQSLPAAPVILGDQTLFTIQNRVGSFSPQERAKAVSGRLLALADDATFSLDQLEVDDQDGVTILAGETIVVAITAEDAKAARLSIEKLAQRELVTIQEGIATYRQERSPKSLLWATLLTLLLTAIVLLIFGITNRLFPKIYGVIEQFPFALRIQSLEVLSTARIRLVLLSLAKTVRYLFTIIISYLYASFALSAFPQTRGIGRSIISYSLGAVQKTGEAFVAYLPNLSIVILIIFVTFYAIKLFDLIFTALGNGNLTLPGFFIGWAKPTQNLLTFFALALAFTVILPYIPGSQSPAFQATSVFLGLVFSLSSSTIVSNVIAGIILIYTRAFELGDRVKIADVVGDVVEKTLLVTRIRTIKNVVVTIPNAAVLNGNVVNYSLSMRDYQANLILNTTVTLGYDIPWRKVHETLLQAAAATTHILVEPKPFILQTSLENSYVAYELNAYTDKPNLMAQTYAELHQNMQDKCNEADIEILSPIYSALRDGNHTTIPSNYLPPGYKSSAFQVKSETSTFNGEVIPP